MCWLRIWPQAVGVAVQQRTRGGDTAAMGTLWAAGVISRSHARPGAGWKSGAFLMLKRFERQKNENCDAASALEGSVCFISPEWLRGFWGRLPFCCPHQQCVFLLGKRKKWEAGLGVGEVTHLRLVLNPFSAADFLCVCKSRANQNHGTSNIIF